MAIKSEELCKAEGAMLLIAKNNLIHRMSERFSWYNHAKPEKLEKLRCKYPNIQGDTI